MCSWYVTNRYPIPCSCTTEICGCWIYCRIVGEAVRPGWDPQGDITTSGNLPVASRAVYTKRYYVKALRTSPYHLQTNGLVECFNQTPKEMLWKTAQEDGIDWDRCPHVLSTYGEVPRESTGFPSCNASPCTNQVRLRLQFLLNIEIRGHTTRRQTTQHERYTQLKNTNLQPKQSRLVSYIIANAWQEMRDIHEGSETLQE